MKRITVTLDVDDTSTDEEAAQFVHALVGAGIMDLNDAPEDFDHPRGSLVNYVVREVE